MITSSQLKSFAKIQIKGTKPSVYLVSAVFLITVLILSTLVSFLSGQQYLTSATQDELEQYVAQPSEENLLKIADEYLKKAKDIKPAGIVLSLVVILMNSMVTAGFEGYCLMVSRGQKTRVFDIFCCFEQFGKVMLLVILRAVLVAVGTILFIIPGIIASYGFSQCYRVHFDHPEYSAFKCLRESMRIMKGHKMGFFFLEISFIGWHFADRFVSMLFVVPFLQIFLQPYTNITYAHFYNLLTGYIPEHAQQNQA